MPLVLSLGTTEKIYLQLPFRYSNTLMRSTLLSPFVVFCWLVSCRKIFPAKEISSSSWHDTNETAHAHISEPQLLMRFPFPCRHLRSLSRGACKRVDSSATRASCWMTALLLPGLKGSLQSTFPDTTVIPWRLNYSANKLSLSCRGKIIKGVMTLILNCVADPLCQL